MLGFRKTWKLLVLADQKDFLGGQRGFGYELNQWPRYVVRISDRRGSLGYELECTRGFGLGMGWFFLTS